MKKGDNSPVRLSSLGFFSFSVFPFIFVSKSRKFIPTSLTTKTTTGAAPNTHKIFHSYRQRSKATQDGSKESRLFFQALISSPNVLRLSPCRPQKEKKKKKRGTKKKFVENVNGDNVYRWRDVTAVHRRPHNATKPRARAPLFVFPLVIASIYSNYFSTPGCDVTSGEDDYLRQGKRGGGRGGSGRSKRRARKYNNGKKRIPTQKQQKQIRGFGSGARERERERRGWRAFEGNFGSLVPLVHAVLPLPPHQFEPRVVASRIGRGVRRGRSGRQCARDPATRRWL